MSSPEPITLNVVTITSTFIPSADVLPWHHYDENPGFNDPVSNVKVLQINPSKFSSNIYTNLPQAVVVEDIDDGNIHDVCTIVSNLDVDNLADHFVVDDPKPISVKADVIDDEGQVHP